MLLGACSSESAARHDAPAAVTAPLAAAAPTQPAFRLTASIHDLMEGVIDPSADVLWDSVATISRQSGVEERRPRTDEEWNEVRRHAVILLEATNLLIMEGRRVSHTYLPASGYGGDLDSTQMQARIDANRPLFIAFARGVHDAGSAVLRAVDARDPDAVFDTGSALDQACENCHTTFWYPDLPRE
ncbi:MAG: hypothetical protein ABW321_28905 [Polyangiales bacterium]